MAAQINTNNEGEGDTFNFDKWIVDNNLTKVKSLFIKYNMKELDKLNIMSNECQQLMSDDDLLQKPHLIPIIFAALKRVTKPIIKVKKVKIYITKEEEESQSKLNKYFNKVLLLKKDINKLNDSLILNINKCSQNIDKLFNNLIKQINSKKIEIKNKLKEISEKIKLKISSKYSIINNEEINIKNGIKNCNKLQDNPNIDKIKRKNQIVSLINNILNNKINDIININTDITLNQNKDIISSFLDNLCDISFEKEHPIPIIDNIECKSITTTRATVHLNASLSKQDLNRKISSSISIALLCINKDFDEKEKESINSSFIKFNKNEKNYKFKLNNLRKNKYYYFNLNLYKINKNKQNIKINHFKPILIKFKTESYDVVDKVYNYKSDFDTNGIIYDIATNYGKKQWQNPCKTGLITVTSSGWQSGVISNVVARKSGGGSYTTHKKNGWICIDFGTKIHIKPTSYTLRHDNNDCYYLRNWNFEGSNNGNDWTIIKQHTNDQTLKTINQSHTWNIQGCNQSYRMFRILIWGVDSSGAYHIFCHGFEIYGHLTGNK